jgi:DNA (cytosine-5)-methyltransferase 1
LTEPAVADVCAENGGEMSRRQARKISAQSQHGVSIRAVDLFCGAGGLTRGLEASGIDVRFGVDVDPSCEFPYVANNAATFQLRSVEELSAADISRAFTTSSYSLIAGCAPCQPFSTYQRGKHGPTDERWHLLKHFARLVEQCSPDLVTMENVPGLERQQVFRGFVKTLQRAGYNVNSCVVNCMDYGVPQHRNRLVLLASKLGSIELIPPSTPGDKAPTVRDKIGMLPPLKAGAIDPSDPLHQACELSPLNLKRIRASKPGGTWRDWKPELVAECHRRESGKTYPSVYGRMSWDAPSPTVTTQYYGFGNGRFGHPEQNRAISLREGAILQSFPHDYAFVPPGEPIHKKTIGRLIGNAVPVDLGKAIGLSLVRHIKTIERKDAA